MEDREITAKVRPRVVVIFNSREEFEEFENYAKSKSLDVKSFIKFAGRTYMDKYPRLLNRTR